MLYVKMIVLNNIFYNERRNKETERLIGVPALFRVNG